MASEEATLVARVAAGDESAYRALLAVHLAPLNRYARRMLGDRDEADDVTQEVFVRLWTDAHRYRPEAARLTTWLHRIAHNLCVDWQRRHGRISLTGDALPETVVWSNQPDMRLQDVVCVGMGADCFYHRPIFINGWISKRETWRCLLSIDPAGRGADELAWAVLAEYAGNLYLLESGGTTLGYADEILQHLAKVAKKWDVSYVVSESNLGSGMFTQLLKPHLMREHPCTIEEVHNSQRKEQRLADVLAPVIQQHRLVVNTRVIKDDYRLTDEDPERGYQRSLFFQMSRLVAGERGCLPADDRIDALAIGVAWFVEATAQDQERTASKRQEALNAEAMEAWMDETGAHVDALALGWKPSPVTAGKSYGGVSPLTVGGR